MSAWNKLSETFGFTFDPESNAITHTPAAESQTRIVPLVQQRVISVIGPDAEKFLQGQLTCNMAEAIQLGSRLGAHCNIKGSMIALYRTISVEGGFWLRLHHESAEAALKNLRKYIVFSKAEALDESNNILGLGLIGPGAASLVEKICDLVPTETDKVVSAGQIRVVKVPGERYEVWLPADQIEAILKQLHELAPFGTTQDWLLSEIQAGIPDLRVATQEAFIPQMTNLQALKGVSFNKGCYTGQEIVTRLQHRGKLTKPMYLAKVTTDTTPEVGSNLHSSEKENVGTVLLAAPSGEQQVTLLAVINKTQADEHTIHLNTPQGPTLEIQSLPYELDPELFEAKR